MAKLNLTPADMRLLKGVGIEDPEDAARKRQQQIDTEQEVFDYLTGEDRAELWDREMRDRVERDALDIVLDGAEQRARNERGLWLVALLLWVCAVALVVWKLGWF